MLDDKWIVTFPSGYLFKQIYELTKEKSTQKKQ